MQIQSKNKEAVWYLPYSFTQDYPFYEWGDQKYTPPSDNNHLHRHNCMEIGYCYEGSGIFLEGSRSASFVRGDVSVVLADCPHIACSNSADMSQWHFLMVDEKRLLEMFPGELTAPLKELEEKRGSLPVILRGTEYPEIGSMVKMLMEQFATKPRNYKSTAKGLMLALLSLLPAILEPLEHEREEMGSGVYESIVPAFNLISNNLAENISVKALAELCRMSQSTLRRSFKRVTGLAPMDFLYDARIKLAAALLREGECRITDVAEAVGYDSISSFNRHFKKYMGVSPTEYRKGVTAPASYTETPAYPDMHHN